MDKVIHRLIAGIFCIMLVCFTPTASAYDLKPIVIQLAPSGSGASQTVLITNTHKTPIAIEVSAFTRKQNPDGTEERKPENENILISPPQMVIPPKASQTFKVRWVGDAAPEKEIAFRLITTQLPIKFKKEKIGDITANVDVGYRYEAALYIVPPKSKPLARLTAINSVTDDKGKSWLEVKVASEGSRRAILDKPVLTVKPKNGGSAVKLEGAQVAALANLNILVGNERVVRLPWPEGLSKGPLEGQLQTEYTVFN